ncbi:HD domain-containing protein [Alphaproteobacteria bacterium]|nr:HD domain-containing protein [Alphaproteobacteria bacterium]|tara:strand:+ start:118 stop:693 length:576 start_codon:yes stop_codon:yes gene_type:complete
MKDSKEVSFTRLDQSTEDDFKIIHPFMEAEHSKLVERLMYQLLDLSGPRLGFKVDRLEHSLQTATRAHRDGADIETVVCALLHDIGDKFAPDNHGAFASEILKPYISNSNYNIVRYHPEFQGYFFFDKIGADPNIRDRHKNEEWFNQAHKFCELWDMPAFDPNYKSEKLDFFEPMLKEVFFRKPAHNGVLL